MPTCVELRPALLRVAEGDAGPDEALAVARHLSDCTACRILLAREVRLERALGSLDDPVPVNEGFLEEVMGSLPDRPPASRRKRMRLTIAGGTGAILLAAFTAAARLPWPSDPRSVGFPTLDAMPFERAAEVAGAAALWFRLALEGAFGLPAFDLPALRAVLPTATLAAAGITLAVVGFSAFVLAVTSGRVRQSLPPG